MKKSGLVACLAVTIACGGSSKKPTPAPPAPEPTPVADMTPAPEKTPEPAPPPPPPPAGSKSLYDRLGGLDAINAVVAEFVANTTTDPRIKDVDGVTAAGWAAKNGRGNLVMILRDAEKAVSSKQ